MTEQAESQTRIRSAAGPPQPAAAVMSSREKQAAALPHPPPRAHDNLNQGPANTGPRLPGWGNPRPQVDQRPLLQAAESEQDPGGRGGARTPMSSPAAQEIGPGLNWPGQPSSLPLGQCPSEHSSNLSNEATTGGLVQGVEPSGSSGRWEERPGLSLSAC